MSINELQDEVITEECYTLDDALWLILSYRKKRSVKP